MSLCTQVTGIIDKTGFALSKTPVTISDVKYRCQKIEIPIIVNYVSGSNGQILKPRIMRFDLEKDFTAPVFASFKNNPHVFNIGAIQNRGKAANGQLGSSKILCCVSKELATAYAIYQPLNPIISPRGVCYNIESNKICIYFPHPDDSTQILFYTPSGPLPTCTDMLTWKVRYAPEIFEKLYSRTSPRTLVYWDVSCGRTFYYKFVLERVLLVDEYLIDRSCTNQYLPWLCYPDSKTKYFIFS